MRAGDFDGARDSIAKCNNSYSANASSVHLAEALAGAGDHERAFQVLRDMGTDHGWRQDFLDDGVRMRWLEYLISTRDFRRADLAVEEFAVPNSRPVGLRKLALAYAEGGDKAAAQRCLQEAIRASTAIADEFDRAKCLWQIADAQIAASESAAAAATLRFLTEDSGTFKDGWARVAALREAAVRAATINERQLASQLFSEAVDAHRGIKPPTPCPERSRIAALKSIAEAQAGAGYINEAFVTARMIEHSDKDFWRDGSREEAIDRIAVAQAKAGDISNAIQTALAVEHYPQYKDEALLEIVELLVTRTRLPEALTTVELIADPPTRATATLRVAAAHAKSGDKETAKCIARQIRLTSNDFLPLADHASFDYAKPETWGIIYDERSAFTMASHRASVDKAQKLAAAAMTLAHALDEHHDGFAVLFKDILDETIVFSLARAQAMSGDDGTALAWSRQIGSDERIGSKEECEAVRLVQLRVYALLGVAEGILAVSEVKTDLPPPSSPTQ